MTNVPQISRRMLLGGAGVAGVASVLPVTAARADEASDFALLRSRYRELTIGNDFDLSDPLIADGVAKVEEAAQLARESLVPDANRDRVFSDLPLTASASIAVTCTRLLAMANAHQIPTAQGHQDPDLLAEIVAGLDTLEQEVYTAGADEFDNWWHWEIGAPASLATILIMLEGLIPAVVVQRCVAALDWFVADPAWQFERYPNRGLLESSGTNRVDLCRNALLIGMVAGSVDHMTLATDRLSTAFAYGGELPDTGFYAQQGLYPDGSFLYQGRVPYSGSYGSDMMAGLTRLLGLLGGTAWEVTDPRVNRIIEAVDKAFAPIIMDGQVMDGVRGRSIARWGTPAFSYGIKLVESTLRLSPAADAATQERWRNMCAGWLERAAAVVDPLESASLPRISVFKELLDDPTVEPADEPVGFTLFPTMARVVHRGQGWACMLNAASDRVSVYDYQLGENYRGFHTAAGWTQLYTSADPAQYSDEFWPTIDLYGLPGTTVDTQELPPGSGGTGAGKTLAPNAWAGGVALDSGQGTFGQHLHGVGSSMTAHQSWFCLPDRIVALGAGIVGGSGEPIVTTIENRNLHADGSEVLTVNGTSQPVTPDWDETFPSGSWAHLEGVAGYVLLDDRCQLKASRLDRTGSWREVNNAGMDDPITRRYVSLWLDHGEGQVPEGIFVDTNSAAEDFTAEGSWVTSPTLKGYTGELCLGTSPGHAGSARAIWRPLVEVPGNYTVEVWFPPYPNNAPTAPYTVTHADGEDTVVLNQLTDAGSWQSLGVYEFEAGRAEVRMEVDGSGFPKADAVRLTRTGDDEAAPNSSYAYALVPGATVEQTSAVAASDEVSILANSTQVQAVEADNGGTVLANFFAAGSVRRLSVDGPCAIGLSTGAVPVRLAVSDPTGKRDQVEVQVALGRATVASKDATVSAHKTGATVTVTVDTSDRDGRTHMIELDR